VTLNTLYGVERNVTLAMDEVYLDSCMDEQTKLSGGFQLILRVANHASDFHILKKDTLRWMDGWMKLTLNEG
jgi:hypothetical protein